MPALSPTMEEGTLAKWLVKEGDVVAAGDILAEIETDKATMEVESIDEGRVGKILVAAGTASVKVNTPILILAEDGEDLLEVAKQDGATKTVATTANAPADTAAIPQDAKPVSVNSKQQDNSNNHKIFASPLAKRLAKQAQIDLSQIVGTGPHGRIIERDINSFIANKGKAADVSVNKEQAVVPSSVNLMPDDQKILQLYNPDLYEVKPHDTMRKTIARRLLESKLTVPHFYLTIDCDLDALLKLRAEINASAPISSEGEGKPAYKLSVNDMVIKAVALALRDVPAANVSWLESGMLCHKTVDVGVAVSIEGGLITPVIRNADNKSLVAISNEMKDLAKRARAKRLKPEEYQGGSTSVSNLGMFGVKSFSAIVNPPQSSIFAIGAGEKRVVFKDDKFVAVNQMSVTISSDHRAVDGALSAELAARFKHYIEKPLALLV